MTPLTYSSGYILHIDGRLGAPTNRQIRHQIGSLLRRGERHIILDLIHVNSIDAAGVGELVQAHNMARAAGASVQFVNPNAHVRALIERAGLSHVLLTGDIAVV